MAYACTVERKAAYLHVRVSGENNPETVARYVADVIAACRREGLSRVLVEEDLAGPSLSVADIFGVVQARSEQGPPPAVTIAYVDVNPDHDPSQLRFAENTARNRGFLFHLFATVREAEEWLAAR